MAGGADAPHAHAMRNPLRRRTQVHSRLERVPGRTRRQPPHMLATHTCKDKTSFALDPATGASQAHKKPDAPTRVRVKTTSTYVEHLLLVPARATDRV